MRLRILHVSDTHCSYDNVAAIARLAQRKDHDCIICTGDLGNYVNVRDDISEMQAESDAHQVLLKLENDHDLPVYFLPGNHDPITLMALPKAKTRVGSRAINMHGQAGIELAPGLRVCGLGGAVPGVQGGYIVWEGFPYTEQQSGEHLQRVWTAASALPDQVLLLTHCGPYDVGTTVCWKDVDREPIQSGSTNLRRLLCTSDVQRKVVANLHGHTHDATGMAQVGSVPIINPGSLMEGRYATVVLHKPQDGEWSVQSVAFERLSK